jgi:hypothetical protein
MRTPPAWSPISLRMESRQLLQDRSHRAFQLRHSHPEILQVLIDCLLMLQQRFCGSLDPRESDGEPMQPLFQCAHYRHLAY